MYLYTKKLYLGSLINHIIYAGEKDKLCPSALGSCRRSWRFHSNPLLQVRMTPTLLKRN